MKNVTKTFLVAPLVAGLLTWAQLLPAAPDIGRAQPASAHQLEQWQAMRFGLFIHWGPVSLKGTEIGWSRGAQVPIADYDQLYKKFNPVKFDADEWVKVARDAGVKYLVFTTKHHDGFCMWDSKETDFNIMHSPFGRDVVQELSTACRRQGILFCAYYSICDWRHPNYPLGSPGGKSEKAKPDMEHYTGYLKRQLSELIGNYGPLGVLWFDGEWEKPWTVERGLDLEAYLHRLQPSLIINNRISKARAGMAGTSAPGQFAGDYDTPEQRIGGYQDSRPWETCMTLCRQWAWKPDDAMKSLEQCLQTLILCAGGDGNLLLNVGPTPEGLIEARQVERLREMGAWLGRNGKSIYGTRGGPWKPTRNLASTRRGNTVFLHVLRWSGDTVELPALARKITSVALLDGGKAEARTEANHLVIHVPADEQRAIDTIVKLELDGSAMELPAVKVVGDSEVKATASNVFQKEVDDYGPGLAFDHDRDSRWATDAGTKQAWIVAAFPKPRRVRSARISEAVPYDNRVQKFEFQYREGDAWKTIFSGTKLGNDFRKKFEPVTAREFRLNILDATEGPTLAEIELPSE